MIRMSGRLLRPVGLESLSCVCAVGLGNILEQFL